MTFTLFHAALMAAIVFGAIMLAYQRGQTEGMKEINGLSYESQTTAIEGTLTNMPMSPEATKQQAKFYITGGRTEDARGYRDDCAVPPLVSHGTDRLDALTRSGLTVWTEDEWKDIKGRVSEYCKGTPKP